jgi:plastocyanin
VVGVDGSSPPSADGWGFSLPSTHLSVAQGTVVKFMWNSAFHDVMQVTGAGNFSACAKTGIVLAQGANSGSFSVSTANHNAGDVLYYICSVSTHCNAGVKIQITVQQPGTVAPSHADTAAPTLPPACSTFKSKTACAAASCSWNKKKKKCLPASG